MHGPLSLVIDDGNGGRHVSLRSSGVRYKKSAYGGDIDLSCTLNVPRGFFTNLGAGADAYLYDGRTGATVWQGTIDNPGAVSGPAGDSYSLHAFGGATRLQAVRKPLAYVHALDDGWRRMDSTKGAKVDEQQKNDGTPTLEVSWEKKFELESGDQGQFVHRALQGTGLKLGRIRAMWDAGRTDTDLTVAIRTGTSIDTLLAATSETAKEAGGSLAAWVGGGGIGANEDVAGLRLRYTGPNLLVKADTGTGNVADGKADTGTGDTSGGVPDKSYWARFFDVIVRQVLRDKYGNDLTNASHYSATDANTVYAHEVIRDMVGRNMCPGLDPDNVEVETTTYEIDALSWLDGITMGDALNELLIFERNLFWTVYGDALTVATWDHTNPRYVISKRDGGISLPGQEITLCNRVLVSWSDRRGREQTTVVEATVEGLDYTRDAEPITLPEGTGSAANAQRAGEKILELNNDPPRAGTAVVRRSIRDLWTGCDVLPHEIMPGCVVVEMESGDDFRLTEVDYSDSDGAAVLTLGEPVRTEAQVMARLERKQRRRRR